MVSLVPSGPAEPIAAYDHDLVLFENIRAQLPIDTNASKILFSMVNMVIVVPVDVKT